MSSNRVTLAQLVELPVGEIATLPVEQIAMLLEDLAAEEGRVKKLKEWLNGALTLRYGQRAADLRKADGKDSGRVRIAEDDGFVVVADAPKKVEWNQDALASAVSKLEAMGEDTAEYVQTELKVSESKYSAWPRALKALFEPARTVSAGRQTFAIEKAKSGRRAA